MSQPTPGNLLVVSAPSGGGKTSLTHAAIQRLAAQQHHCRFSVSYTTRAPRPGERDGEHYHFIEMPEFQRMAAAGEFLEHATVFGNGYGTGRAATESLLAAGDDVILDIDWQGWHQVRDSGAPVTGIFILPPDSVELERRLRQRGTDSDAEIAKRMAQARDEMSHCHEYDYLIINQDFDRATDQLVAILQALRLRIAPQQHRWQAQINGLLA